MWLLRKQVAKDDLAHRLQAVFQVLHFDTSEDRIRDPVDEIRVDVVDEPVASDDPLPSELHRSGAGRKLAHAVEKRYEPVKARVEYAAGPAEPESDAVPAAVDDGAERAEERDADRDRDFGMLLRLSPR